MSTIPFSVPHYIRSYEFRLATDVDMREVYRLTHDSLVRIGEIAPKEDGLLVSYPGLDGIPQTSVVIASYCGRLVGTNSLTIDGPQGLHTDYGFGRYTDRIRKENRRLASSWRIATDPEFRDGKWLVEQLIVETFRIFLELDLETCLFIFPPRFERVYQKLICAQTVAKGDIRVNNTVLPAVMMRADVERILELPIVKRRNGSDQCL